MNVTIAFLIANHQFLKHFFIEIKTKKSRYPHRRKLADACKESRELLGVSNGDYGRQPCF